MWRLLLGLWLWGHLIGLAQAQTWVNRADIAADGSSLQQTLLPYYHEGGSSSLRRVTARYALQAAPDLGLAAGLQPGLDIDRSEAPPFLGHHHHRAPAGLDHVFEYFTGGVGKVTGAVIGAFIMGVMNNGMSIMGIGIDWQQVIKGAVLMLAVFLDVYNKNKG
mgnify:CR=1 FL=1